MGLVTMKMLKNTIHFASLSHMPEPEIRTENSVTCLCKHSSNLNGLSIRLHSAWPGEYTDQPTVYT